MEIFVRLGEDSQVFKITDSQRVSDLKVCTYEIYIRYNNASYMVTPGLL